MSEEPAKPRSSASSKEGAIDLEMDGSDDYSQFLDEGEFDESFNATNASFVDEFEAIRNEITSKVLGYYAHVIYNGDSNALTQGARVRRRSDQNEY